MDTQRNLSSNSLFNSFSEPDETDNNESKIESDDEMNYNVGFMGCDRNEKNEVFPVQAWVVSEFPLDNNGKGGFEDPISQK